MCLYCLARAFIVMLPKKQKSVLVVILMVVVASITSWLSMQGAGVWLTPDATVTTQTDNAFKGSNAGQVTTKHVEEMPLSTVFNRI